jgi:hypothetical protein
MVNQTGRKSQPKTPSEMRQMHLEKVGELVRQIRAKNNA